MVRNAHGRALVVVMAIVMVLLSAPATVDAHHSFAAYDQERTLELRGVVKEFRWVNPHIGLLFTVEEAGQSVDYLLAGGSLSGLIRAGWRKTSLAPGDLITARFHPLRDGGKGGELLTVTLANGTTLGDNAGAPPQLAP